MIKWIPSDKTKPPIDKEDALNEKNQISSRVLVAITDNGKFKSVGFGRYLYNSKNWRIENHMGDFGVSHWAPVNQPEY